jgi:hypothetical protein
MTADTYTPVDAAYPSWAFEATGLQPPRRHMRTLRSRREETGRPGESGEVAGVVNAMDGGKSTAMPLDLVNAGGAKI